MIIRETIGGDYESFTLSRNGIGNLSNIKQDTPAIKHQCSNEDVDDELDFENKDEVIAGMKFELGKMIKPDRQRAKELVLQNLFSNPKYYENLNQFGMNTDEDNDYIEGEYNSENEGETNVSYE